MIIKDNKKIGRILNDKEAKSEKVNLSTSDGKNFGTISAGAFSAIRGNYLDDYSPIDDNERNVLNAYKNYAAEQAKVQAENEKQEYIKNTPALRRYNIDPDNFGMADFEKWAKEHGFEYRMGGNDWTGAEYKWLPKQKDGWKFWEVIPSKEEQSDKETLEILAENNERRLMSKTDKGAISSAARGALDSLTFGAVEKYADWKAEKDYKKSGLNIDDFVGYKQANAKTQTEHIVANTLGSIAGSIPSFMVAGAAVEEGLSKIPKYAELASKAAKGVQTAQKTKNLIDAAATVATTTAISSSIAQEWNKDGWYKSAGNVILDVTTSSLGAYLGGKLSTVVGQRVANILKSTKLSPAAVKAIASSSSAFTFAGTTTGVQEMVNAAKCAVTGTEYRPDIKSIATNMAVLTLYSGLKTYAKETIGTTNSSGYEEPFEYFTEEDMKSPEALKKKMRQYAKQYHPDKFQSKGERSAQEANDIFSKINTEYSRAKQKQYNPDKFQGKTVQKENNIFSKIKAEYERAKQKWAVNILNSMEKKIKRGGSGSTDSETVNNAVVLLNEIYVDNNNYTRTNY